MLKKPQYESDFSCFVESLLNSYQSLTPSLSLSLSYLCTNIPSYQLGSLGCSTAFVFVYPIIAFSIFQIFIPASFSFTYLITFHKSHYSIFSLSTPFHQMHIDLAQQKHYLKSLTFILYFQK